MNKYKIITCPNCGVVYNIDKIHIKNIICCDCNHNYHQGFCSDKMPEWIKNMSTKLSKTLDFWKGL